MGKQNVSKTNLFHEGSKKFEERATDSLLRVLLRSNPDLLSEFLISLGIKTQRITKLQSVSGDTRVGAWVRTSNQEILSFNGMPDLIIELPDDTLLVFEVKWDDTLKFDQLEKYYRTISNHNGALLVVLTKREHSDRSLTSKVSPDARYISWSQTAALVRRHALLPGQDRLSTHLMNDFLDLLALRGVGIMTHRKFDEGFKESVGTVIDYFEQQDQMERNRVKNKKELERYLCKCLQLVINRNHSQGSSQDKILKPSIPNYSERKHIICSRSMLEIAEGVGFFVEYFIDNKTPNLRVTWLLEKERVNTNQRELLLTKIDTYKSKSPRGLLDNHPPLWETPWWLEYDLWINISDLDWPDITELLVDHGWQMLQCGLSQFVNSD